VSWWRAEGNLLDSAGTNNGTALGTINYAAGEVGQAFVFNGASYIRVPASRGLDVGQSSGFTIEAWIKPANQNLQDLFEWNQNNGVPSGAGQIGTHMYINANPGDGSFWGNIVDTNAISHSFYSTNGLIKTNALQHVAMTYDKASGMAFLYWNGLQVASTNFGSLTPQTSFDFFMGNRPSGFFTDTYFQGEVDEPALYNRALSQSELQGIYNAGSAGKCTPLNSNCTPPPSGLVGWWRGEDNSLDSALNNNGIPQGITYANGEVGQSFSFNGSGSSYVRVPASQSIDVGQGNGFTLELWCNPSSTNGPVDPVTLVEWNDKSGTLEGIGCHLEIYSPGKILGDIVDPSTGNDHFLISAPGNVTPNVWQHLAMTYDRTTGIMTLYRNGVIVTNGNVGIWKPSTSFDLYFGIRAAGVFAPIPYQGLLDEISLYNRVLSPSEIQAIYNADSAGKCPPSNSNCTPPPSGIVAWWPGQGTPTDIIGGNNGTLNAVSYVPGEVGEAFSFNGTSSYMLVPATPVLDVGQGNGFTFEAWVNPASPTVPYLQTIFMWNQNNGVSSGVQQLGSHMQIGGAGLGDLYVNITDTAFNSHHIFSPNYQMQTNTWQHVAVTYDKTTGNAVLYWNGTSVAAQNLGIFTPLTGYDFFLGYTASGYFTGSYFNGEIDEPSIYNRVLSAAEVQSIYAAGFAGKCTPSNSNCTPPPSGLVGWWRAEGNLLDSVGANNGTAHGTISYAAGEVGQAFVFNGASSIIAPASPSLDVGKGGGCTIEAWINPSDVSTQHPILEWNTGTVFGSHFWISVSSGTGPGCLYANLIDTSGTGHLVYSANNLISANVFQHVALTYDKASGVAMLYLNGTNVAQTTIGSVTLQTSYDLYFGYRPPEGGLPAVYWVGDTDEVSLYNRALTAAEIQAIYRADGAGKCVSSSGGVAPTIISQPASQSVFPSNTVTFSATAQGTSPLSYQWFFNSNSLAGKTNSTLTLTNVQPAQQGYYSVTVTNAFGKAASSNAFLTVLPPPVCVHPPSGIVAWWRAESNTVDSIGINDGLPQGSQNSNPVMLYTNGKVGTAFLFNGTTYLQVPASTDLNVGAGVGLTVEGWVRPTSTGATQPLLEWSEGRNVGVGLFLNFSNFPPGTIAAHFTDTNSFAFGIPRRIVLRSTNSVITNGVWQHVALTVDRTSGLATIYVNGRSVAQTNLGTFPLLTQGPVYMGFGPALNPPILPFPGSRFTGAMDEFSIYNRALSATEIQSIVHADIAGKCPPPPPPCTPAPTGIVAWWRGQSNALDSVDSHNGLIIDSVVYTNGEVGTGFQFNSGLIRVPASSSLDLGTGQGLTVELWVKPAGLAPQPFVEWNNVNGLQGVYLGYGTSIGTLEGGLAGTNGALNVLRSPLNLVSAGSWVHVAMTYDKSSGIAALYYNGSQVAFTNFGSFTPRTSTDLFLGGSRFIGAMDEVSLYNRALTSLEIRSIVAARNAGKCTDAPFIITQPISQRVTKNFSATFNVVAGGTPNLHYQWRFNGVPISGATNSSYTLASVQPSNAGPYSVLVTNVFGSVLSSNAVLRVNLPPVPIITVSPLANFPCNNNLFVIAACGPTALVAFDGSKSFDPDDPTFSYSWFEGTNLFSTNVVATNQLALGSHQITLFVDDHVLGGTNSTTVIVQVISLADAVNLMIDFVNCSGISHAQPLLASLKAAADSFGRGNNTSGVNQLGAFQNKVQAQVMPGNPALAASFLQATQQILDALSLCDSTHIPHGQIVSLARHQDGKMHIKLTGTSASVQLVQASTNLVDWVVVGTATQNADGTYDFDDSNAANLQYRFYRVVPLQGP
jgi:hypothetical protein